MAWEKTTERMQNLLEKTYLKLTMSSFRWIHTEIGSELSIVQRHATVNKERWNGVNVVIRQIF